MYVLYVYFFITLNTGTPGLESVEMGGFPTMQECWAEATHLLEQPKVATVRCAWVENYEPLPTT